MRKKKSTQEASRLAISLPHKTRAEAENLMEGIRRLPNFLKEMSDYLKNSFNKFHTRAMSTLPPVRVIDVEALESRCVEGSKITPIIAKSLAEALTHKIDKSN